MSPDVRRVAVVLKDCWRNHPISYDSHEMWDRLARHALLALREPSKEMMAAIESADPGADTWPGAWDYLEKLAVAQWQAMIDAALAETPTSGD